MHVFNMQATDLQSIMLCTVFKEIIIMVSNINGNYLLYSTMFMLLLMVALIVYLTVRAVKKGNKVQGKSLLVSLICFVIIAVSWIFNMGWYRVAFIVTFMAVPVFSTLVLFVTNYAAAGCFEHSRRIKKLNLLFIITYLSGNLLMPDGGDIGEMYFFFGLIHSNTLAKFAYLISSLLLAAHYILFVWQIIEVFVIKVKLKKQTKQAAGDTENSDL